MQVLDHSLIPRSILSFSMLHTETLKSWEWARERGYNIITRSMSEFLIGSLESKWLQDKVMSMYVCISFISSSSYGHQPSTIILWNVYEGMSNWHAHLYSEELIQTRCHQLGRFSMKNQPDQSLGDRSSWLQKSTPVQWCWCHHWWVVSVESNEPL